MKISPPILTDTIRAALEALRFLEGDLIELAERIGRARRPEGHASNVDCMICKRTLALLAFQGSAPGGYVCLRHKPLNGQLVEEVLLLDEQAAASLCGLLSMWGQESGVTRAIPTHDFFRVGPSLGIEGRLCLSMKQLERELGFIDVAERRRALGGRGSASPAAVLAAAGKGEYIKLNLLTNDPSSCLLKAAVMLDGVYGPQRIGSEYWPASLQDGTLLLLAIHGKNHVLPGTPFHLDRLHALNLAFYISNDESQTRWDKPVALWYFFHERHETEVKAAAAGLGLSLESVLNEESASRLAAAVGVDTNGWQIFHILRQYSGQPVHVAPGVFHSVFNLEPSLKIAIDVMLRDFLALYGKLLSERFVDDVRVPDYGHVDEVLTRILLN